MFLGLFTIALQHITCNEIIIEVIESAVNMTQLILSQLRWLDHIVDESALTDTFLDILMSKLNTYAICYVSETQISSSHANGWLTKQREERYKKRN